MRQARQAVVLFVVAVGAVGAVSVLAADARAAGKKPPAPPAPTSGSGESGVLKRALQLDPIADRYIELPDPSDPVAQYGQNIYANLIDDLVKTGDYAVLVGASAPSLQALRPVGASQPLTSAAGAPPDPCLVKADVPDASSRVSITVDELSFTVGDRGERMSYGFSPGFDNPYNAGVDEKNRNEFPLRTIQADPTWFENTFADTGHLHDGLGLGSEFDFDLLFVGAKLKHYQYQGAIGLSVTFANRFGAAVTKRVVTHGQGFYFDFSANLVYEGIDYMVGMMLARKTALLGAFDRAVTAAVGAIGTEIRGLPLMTHLAGACGGVDYVSNGANYNVPVGLRFYDLTQLNAGVAPTVFTVTSVYETSAAVTAAGSGFAIGDELVSLNAGQTVPTPTVPQPKAELAEESFAAGVGASGAGASGSSGTSVDAGTVNIDVPSALAQFVEGFFQRLIEGVEALVMLPYNIYRWFAYDQSFAGGELGSISAATASKLAAQSWATSAIGLPQVFAACAGGPSGTSGQSSAACLGSASIIVAVIDSGVDYDHRELRRNIFWDGEANTPGYDFISGDPRPYDDHEHGTTVAGAAAGGGSKLVGAAPLATILPLKAFSPYGITSSAALYASFEYAVAKGARVIVTGWGTRVRSRALEDGVKLAAANGVLVVTAAGDGGVDLGRTPYYPAAFAEEAPGNVVVVAGEDQSGALTQAPGMYSNYGEGVDIAAPGSAVPVETPRNGYGSRSSTGIAAGFVAGAAALAWAACPKASAAQIKSALLGGAAVQENLRGDVAGNRSLFVPGTLDVVTTLCK